VSRLLQVCIILLMQTMHMLPARVFITKDYTMKSNTLDAISYLFMYASVGFSLSMLARAVALNLFA